MKTSEYENTWAHYAWLASGCVTILICLYKSVFVLLTARASTSSWSWLLAAVIAYLTSDLATGIYHWAIDNYGTAETLVFGSQIEGFQGHHHQPWVITGHHLAYNVYMTAAAVTLALFPINILSGDPVLLVFLGIFGACVMFSQQFHAWAHTPKGKLPMLVAVLQDAGVILPRVQHAAHHRPPFDTNYCIVSGLWNGVLDKWRFFTAMEVVIVRLFGCRPRSWTEPNAEWTQKTQLDDGID